MISTENKRIPVKTFYLEMLRLPDIAPINIPENVLILKAEKPTSGFYKFLFNSLGGEWGWTSRLIISENELLKIIHDDKTDIHVLHICGVPAGYFELKIASDGVKLEYFGLFKEFIGKGFGKLFLNYATQKAWSYNPKRFWLHTCEYDHENALSVYLKAGFRVYDEKIEHELYPVEFLNKKGLL